MSGVSSKKKTSWSSSDWPKRCLIKKWRKRSKHNCRTLRVCSEKKHILFFFKRWSLVVISGGGIRRFILYYHKIDFYWGDLFHFVYRLTSNSDRGLQICFHRGGAVYIYTLCLTRRYDRLPLCILKLHIKNNIKCICKRDCRCAGALMLEQGHIKIDKTMCWYFYDPTLFPH